MSGVTAAVRVRAGGPRAPPRPPDLHGTYRMVFSPANRSFGCRQASRRTAGLYRPEIDKHVFFSFGPQQGLPFQVSIQNRLGLIRSNLGGCLRARPCPSLSFCCGGNRFEAFDTANAPPGSWPPLLLRQRSERMITRMDGGRLTAATEADPCNSSKRARGRRLDESQYGPDFVRLSPDDKV